MKSQSVFILSQPPSEKPCSDEYKLVLEGLESNTITPEAMFWLATDQGSYWKWLNGKTHAIVVSNKYLLRRAANDGHKEARVVKFLMKVHDRLGYENRGTPPIFAPEDLLDLTLDGLVCRFFEDLVFVCRHSNATDMQMNATMERMFETCKASLSYGFSFLTEYVISFVCSDVDVGNQIFDLTRFHMFQLSLGSIPEDTDAALILPLIQSFGRDTSFNSRARLTEVYSEDSRPPFVTAFLAMLEVVCDADMGGPEACRLISLLHANDLLSIPIHNIVHSVIRVLKRHDFEILMEGNSEFVEKLNAKYVDKGVPIMFVDDPNIKAITGRKQKPPQPPPPVINTDRKKRPSKKAAPKKSHDPSLLASLCDDKPNLDVCVFCSRSFGKGVFCSCESFRHPICDRCAKREYKNKKRGERVKCNACEGTVPRP